MWSSACAVASLPTRRSRCADDWWTPLVRALRDETTGGLYAYSDERQRVFARFGRPPLALIPLTVAASMLIRRPLTRLLGANMQESAQRTAHLFETMNGVDTL